MTTASLIARLLEEHSAVDHATVEALRELLDDSTIEAEMPLIGVADAAALVGLSAHTLRYYESEGLVRPQRDGAGHRVYGAADLRRLVFLTRMRVSGMVMLDLKRYIALVEQGEHTTSERREMMLDQRERIRRQLRELTLALETTEYKIQSYNGAPATE
ncbi:transcriptional regulator, MerR family [Agreia bicolorata]|uniref:MerR family transcriptional regulator n=1 Tax=Agreia bicolorata TaxID=110935 RepID=A0A1T4YMT1_9MICO|nr:MerR family transcriptional regulator [Agreia bicolorata]KJC62914.1 MerR family transcriptional regulator [Agreia bicolorata]SKB03072.1 transcriptional regulator, MerR family [Agreia bicolorata]